MRSRPSYSGAKCHQVDTSSFVLSNEVTVLAKALHSQLKVANEKRDSYDHDLSWFIAGFEPVLEKANELNIGDDLRYLINESSRHTVTGGFRFTVKQNPDDRYSKIVSVSSGKKGSVEQIADFIHLLLKFDSSDQRIFLNWIAHIKGEVGTGGGTLVSRRSEVLILEDDLIEKVSSSDIDVTLAGGPSAGYQNFSTDLGFELDATTVRHIQKLLSLLQKQEHAKEPLSVLEIDTLDEARVIFNFNDLGDTAAFNRIATQNNKDLRSTVFVAPSTINAFQENPSHGLFIKSLGRGNLQLGSKIVQYAQIIDGKENCKPLIFPSIAKLKPLAGENLWSVMHITPVKRLSFGKKAISALLNQEMDELEEIYKPKAKLSL